MAKFKIGELDLTEDPPYKPVYLNDELIFKLDYSTYMGHRRNQEKELCQALSNRLGYDVTPRQLNSAMILETISDTEPND